MTESCSEGILGNWTPTQCPFKISYSLRTFDDIRLAVMDAFFSLPRGGAEIGGVLLGKRDGQDIAILDHVALDCEHAFGPSFSLSPRDLAHFSLLMEEARKNVPDLQPIGWYHSHTRSEIFLSDADLDIHKRFFPNPWQVALVLKPHTFQPMRAGFFFRETDGSYHAEATYHEFILDPQPLKQIPSGNVPLPTGTGEIRLDSPPTGHVLSLPAVLEPEAPPANGLSVPAELDTPAAGLVSPAPAPDSLPLPTDPIQQPQPLLPVEEATVPAPLSDSPAGPIAGESPFHQYRQTTPPRRWWFTAMLILAVLMAVAALAYQTRSVWLPHVWAGGTQTKVATSLGLNLKDEAGELRIAWDRKNPAIAAASRGTLEISGAGGLPISNRLDAGQLANGNFNFKRDTERVDITLSVEGAAGELGHESASFLGKLPSGGKEPAASQSDAAVTTERDALEVENEQLKRDLKDAIARNQQLLQNADQRGGVQEEAERLRTELNAELARNAQLEKTAKPKDEQIARLRAELNKQLANVHILSESLEAAQAQLRLQQKKRMGNQAGDTAKQ